VWCGQELVVLQTYDFNLWLAGRLNDNYYLGIIAQNLSSSQVIINCTNTYIIMYYAGDIWYYSTTTPIRMNFNYAPVTQQRFNMSSGGDSTIFYDKHHLAFRMLKLDEVNAFYDLIIIFL
jgi:hypothetical protein